MKEDLYEICNIKYKEIKRRRFPELAYKAPELLPNIESDQIKAVIEVFQCLINDINKDNAELKDKIKNLEKELDNKKDKYLPRGIGPF